MERCGVFNDGCCCPVANLIWKSLFSSDCCDVISTARSAAGPKLFSGSLLWEGWTGAELQPSSAILFLSVSWTSTANSQAADGLKGERTRETVKYVGCNRSKLRDFAKKKTPIFFQVSMSLSCVRFRHNAEQEERSFWVPTWKGCAATGRLMVWDDCLFRIYRIYKG